MHMFAHLLAQLPPPEQIRQTSEEVLSRPDYELDTPMQVPNFSWLGELILWLLQPLKWFIELTEGLPEVLRWILIILLVILLIALVAHILYSLISAIRGTPRRLRDDAVSRHRAVDPATLESEAEAASSRGDYIGAIRLLFRASLLRIQKAEKKKFRPGFTNRDLLKRYRTTALVEPLREFVETIDAKWYGEEICVEEDYLARRQDHQRLMAILQERSHAVSA